MPASTQQRYDWKRFWCPRDGQLWVDSEGYLLDPDGEGNWYPRSGKVPLPVPFEAILAKPCLLLLGEPGIGKTDAMEVQRKSAEAALLPGEGLLAIDCRVDRDLKDDLFQHPRFTEWLDGKHTLHLFIDSLDEHPDVDAASRIVGKLRRGPLDRLRLRIACRTAEIPPILEPELEKLWGKDAEGKSLVAVYELAPLRKKDVALAARVKGLDAEAFLSELSVRGATALAIKPVTLEFLLRRFAVKRALPRTRWEIYEMGCRALCEEGSESRLTHKQKGRLDSAQRMAIASRIAAACILGNRAKIYLGADPGDLPDDAWLAEVLGGGQERVRDVVFEVNADAVHETLRMTGLFTEHGRLRLLGWAHQTYAEFLTARFLRERGLVLEDLADILYPPEERIQIVPELREVAAWMASVDGAMFRKLVQDDPRTLLQSDVAMVDDVEREKLVAALLERFENRGMIDLDVGGERVYRKLGHPGLKEQIEPWIVCKDKDWMARRAAIDIAEACGMQALQDALVEVALDTSDHLYTRVQAAHAVAMIGDEQTKRRLLPIAQAQAESDSDDELKGHALTALWPKHISAQILFECLTHPRRKAFYGSYRSFISSLETEGRFSDADLVHALEWLAQQQPVRDPLEHLKDLGESLVRQAWRRMDDAAVLSALVRLADIRFRRHEGLFAYRQGSRKDDLLPADDDARRHKFVAAFLESTSPFELEYWYLEVNKMLGPDDVRWMLGRLDEARETTVRNRWASLIEFALRHKGFEFESMNAVLTAWPRHPEIREAFSWLEPVELGSAREVVQRKAWVEYEERMAESARFRAEHQERLLDPPPPVRVLGCLERFEQGNMNAFWQMQLEMSLRPTSIGYEDRIKPDLTKSPGWVEAAETTRSRILAAAKQFIRVGAPKSERWLGKNAYHELALAGYRALFLLLTQEPEWLEAMPSTVWQRWVSAILGYPAFYHDQLTARTHRSLIGIAYRHAPDETLSVLGILIDDENRRHGEAFITRELVDCWDARFGSFLLTKAKEPSLRPSILGSLLDDLLEHRVEGAREYAASLVSLPLPKQKKVRARARAAAQALLRQAEDAGWPVLEQVFRYDPAFGHNVVLTTAGRMERRQESRWPGLSEDQLAGLFLWMEEQFPHSEDGKVSRRTDSAVTPRESAAGVRKALLASLAQRGTRASLEWIRRIEQMYPGEDWITFTRIRAEEHTLAGARRPLSPEEVIALRPRTAMTSNTHDERSMNESPPNIKPLVERCDVLLMTATEIETRAVLQAARAATGRDAQLVHGGRIYHELGEIGGALVLLVGTAQAGSETPGGSMSTAFTAIGDVAPKAIVMVGIAFGVDPENQPIGRVLYSRQLQCYGPVRIGTDRETGARIDIPRGDKPSATIWLIDSFNTAALSWSGGECEACLMLSGPPLVDNIDYRDTLTKLFPEAKGVRWRAQGYTAPR